MAWRCEQGEGHCNPQMPWTVNLQGPEVVNGIPARHSLVFNPAFPCGVERGQTFSSGDDVPLRVLARAWGCVGEECPGDMVLVRGHVTALQRNFSSSVFPVVSPVRPLGECEAGIISTYPRIKLAVYSCGWSTPVIIDADSTIVVPAGEIRIDVLGPGPSNPAGSDFGLEPWTEGPLRIEDERLLVHVTVRVTACPLRCCYCPPGQLTEYLFTIDDPGIANRILLRPRRARRLEVDPTLVTVATAWLRDTTATLPIFGQRIWTTGAAITPGTVEIVGAAPAIAHSVPGGGTNTSYIRWEIG